MRRRGWGARLLLGLAILTLSSCLEEGDQPRPDTASNADVNVPATAGPVDGVLEFVGSARCGECHPKQQALWHASHHDRAMEAPTPETVEGDFDDQRLRHFDEDWHFTRDAEGFWVELEESDRPLRRWRVAYTFGAAPLQQYLVAFPNGRFQALPVAWDTRPADEGGARWFHLLPDEKIPVGDPLHWEGIAYNWNTQCAACHSTQLEKNYDVESDSFETHFAEIDVGCEACHGPGSRHVDWMSDGGDSEVAEGMGSGLSVEFDAWDGTRWQRLGDARIAAPIRPREHDTEIDVCAPCHSRRSQIVASPEIGAPFLDGHRPALLTSDLYFEDGQILDEVYVYGSFVQSRMFAAGVRCSDCHEPHSLSLREEGNALCENCHSSEAYGSRDHHGHDVEGEGASCVGCHMPDRVYMEVDARRDHSFGLPSPLRSAALGAPSACAACHPEQDAEWAAGEVESWRGARAAPEHWSDELVAEGVRREDAGRWLEIALDPVRTPFVRGSAWSRYAQEARSAPPLEILKARVEAGSDLERLALVDVGRRLSPQAAFSLLGPLLEDDRRAVRIAVADALAEVPATLGRPADRSRLARALREYRLAQESNADRPEAQVNLGVMATRAGDADAARAAYLRALERGAYFVPAYVNLADLERALGRNEASVELLREALAIVPDDAMVHHLLGLALVRAGQPAEALTELEAAARTAPGEPRLVLAWALSLDAAGRRSEAVSRLSEAVDGGVVDAGIYQALATLLRDQGERARARTVALEWSAHYPSDEGARALIVELDSPPR